MKPRPKYRLVEHFAEIDDPRIERTKRHKLMDILTIAILVVICGADSWVAMESFSKAKHQWLKKILELPNGMTVVSSNWRRKDLQIERFNKAYKFEVTPPKLTLF